MGEGPPWMHFAESEIVDTKCHNSTFFYDAMPMLSINTSIKSSTTHAVYERTQTLHTFTDRYPQSGRMCLHLRDRRNMEPPYPSKTLTPIHHHTYMAYIPV
jgi:hypothetical protein